MSHNQNTINQHCSDTYDFNISTHKLIREKEMYDDDGSDSVHQDYKIT